MSRSRTSLAEIAAIYAPPAADLGQVRAVLRRHPYLAALVCRASGALTTFFPEAPLRLFADGDELVIAVQVPDVEAALLGPLTEFDRAWWYAMVPRARGHLSIDVEACDVV